MEQAVPGVELSHARQACRPAQTGADRVSPPMDTICVRTKRGTAAEHATAIVAHSDWRHAHIPSAARSSRNKSLHIHNPQLLSCTAHHALP